MSAGMDELHWSNQRIESQDADEGERRLSEMLTVNSYSFLAKSVDSRKIKCCLNQETYSSQIRLIRVQAWVNRFLHNCAVRIKDSLTGELSAKEVEEAETQIIRTVHKCEFNCERKLLK